MADSFGCSQASCFLFPGSCFTKLVLHVYMRVVSIFSLNSHQESKLVYFPNCQTIPLMPYNTIQWLYESYSNHSLPYIIFRVVMHLYEVQVTKDRAICFQIGLMKRQQPKIVFFEAVPEWFHKKEIFIPRLLITQQMSRSINM